MRTFGAMLGISVLLCASARAADPVTPPANESAVEFRLTGAPTPNGHFTGWDVELKSGVEQVRSIRVFSEPSHTLVAAIVNTADGDPTETEWFRGYAFERGTRTAMFAFKPGAKIRSQGKRPVPGDVKLALHIDAPWGSGSEYREKVVYVTTNVDDFDFTLRQSGTEGMVLPQR